ncbi:hypothetical protein ACGFJC_51440 [Nonomuraea fuscirosea]|uniref:hypothetical protein n=1 Tax=Nonomuraea fuscirosea TaxID=1291556 RepID=UPI00346C3A6C
MPVSSRRDPFSDWLGGHAVPLTHLGLGLSIADLRQARGMTGPDRIRIQSVYVHTLVLEAFDGILNIPTSTVAGLLTRPDHHHRTACE